MFTCSYYVCLYIYIFAGLNCERKMMIPRIVLRSVIRFHHSKSLLNVTQNSSQSRHISYSLGLPLKYYLSVNDKFQFVANFLSYVFYPINLNYSLANVHSQVESLCWFILSEDSIDHNRERFEELKKIITFLLSKGYSSQDIKENFVEYLKSNVCSYVKMYTLAKIDSDIVILLPLLSLSESILKQIAEKSANDRNYIKGFSSRFLYLSHHLELEPGQLIPALAKHPKMLTMQFSRLDNKMKILKDAHIDPKYIVKDLWIFNYSEDALSNRIQAALKAGVELKPWMLRCSEKFFQSIILKYSETQRILHGNDVETYLAKKLDCSTKYVSYMMERNKLLKKINIPKLEQASIYFHNYYCHV